MSKVRRKIKGVSLDLPQSFSESFIRDVQSLPWDESRGGRYAREQLLSKYTDSDSSKAKVRRQKAIEKWLLTEERNARTNQRLLLESTTFSYHNGDKLIRIRSDDLLRKAADFISKVIGDSQSDAGSFSSGASTSRNRLRATLDEKYAGQADVTEGALPYWAHECFVNPFMARTHYGEIVISPNVVPGNILFTVPKSSEIDRVACKEPDLNMYLQKGVGDFIRRRLKKVGIDLNDQTRNQELARLASITGNEATIDLSSASDSMTCQLACRLFSPGWFTMLMALRSPVTIIDGVSHENEMLSSMGNGFTFEVESLVFYALARAVAYFTQTKGIISVYGDDIIIPVAMTKIFSQVLGFCGFLVNLTKSHWEGDFRESCGSHWIRGHCVKPVYIRRPVTTLPDLILHLNALRRWWDIEGIPDPRVEPFWNKYSVFVPKKLHGGSDYSSTLTLFSEEGPGFELYQESRPIPRKELGSYVYWQHSRSPNQEDVLFFEKRRLLPVWRIRRPRNRTR